MSNPQDEAHQSSGETAWIEISQNDDLCRIKVSGDVVGSAHLSLELALASAEQNESPTILLDLDEAANLDARSLHVILRAARRSAGNGNRLKITRGTGKIADIFRLTALDQSLQFDSSR